jgi:hypothetical protein
VAERPTEVADHGARAEIDLLGEKAQVVDPRRRSFEHLSGVVDVSGECVCFSEPEGAEDEGSLLTLQPAVTRISEHRPGRIGERGLDRFDGLEHERIDGREKPDGGDDQRRGVERIRAEKLGEGPHLLVPPPLEDGSADLGTRR